MRFSWSLSIGYSLRAMGVLRVYGIRDISRHPFGDKHGRPIC